ncbi:MAG TPA: hypothetical protein VIG33_11990 [Pseudobdellovibrionaceae bacterium]|jgi:rhodanese-related sulfurtransferase
MKKTMTFIGLLFLFPFMYKALNPTPTPNSTPNPQEVAPPKTQGLTGDPTYISIVNDCGALNERDFAEFNITEAPLESELRSQAKLEFISTKLQGAESAEAAREFNRTRATQQTYAGKIIKKSACSNKDHKFYGVRNLKSVLNGLVFRGGANNVYNHEFGFKENENPLPEIALKNLCIRGFSNAVYLYSKNFKGPSMVNCKTQANENNTLHYIRLQPERAFQTKSQTEDLETLIKLTHEQIMNAENKQRPIYVHCYNGWHASGRAAAFLLQQFCNADPATALSYWIENAHNSYEAPYRAIWKQIVKFDQLKNSAPFSHYKIDDRLKEKVCPDLKNYSELAQKNNEVKTFLNKFSTASEGNH